MSNIQENYSEINKDITINHIEKTDTLDKAIGKLIGKIDLNIDGKSELYENEIKIVEFLDDKNRQENIISMLDKHLIV